MKDVIMLDEPFGKQAKNMATVELEQNLICVFPSL